MQFKLYNVTERSQKLTETYRNFSVFTELSQNAHRNISVFCKH